MLQWYFSDVAYVVIVIHICCKSLFKIFYLLQTHVTSVLSECCIYCNGYVANVCSKYFICFRRMLHIFYLRIAKADLNVGLSSDEERASAGAMAASMWG
jgi:hypothetical protein